jgi:hypothetical protein
MYFEDFPQMLYDYQIGNNVKAFLMTDITRNIRFRKEVLSNITVYDYYDIVDGETPEIISDKIYGTPEYHWIIMLANDMYDYRAEFPMSYLALEQYISDKYGSSADSIHHWIDSTGKYIVDQTVSGATSVSNRQYEEALNESKRRIKIISNDVIQIVLKNYKDQL